MPRDAEVFRQIADEFATAAVSSGKAQQLRLAGCFANDSQQGLDEGGLARTVAAEQSKDFTPLDAQRHALEGLLPFSAEQAFDVGLAQVARFDCGRGHVG